MDRTQELNKKTHSIYDQYSPYCFWSDFRNTAESTIVFISCGTGRMWDFDLFCYHSDFTLDA